MSAVATRVKYAHRKNHDGTFDSICLACYRTAGSSLIENGLFSLECSHACDPVDLWHAQNALRSKAATRVSGHAR
jgi:hypothetical protein